MGGKEVARGIYVNLLELQQHKVKGQRWPESKANQGSKEKKETRFTS